MIEGTLYENRSSANEDAVLHVSNKNYNIQIEDTIIYHGELASLVISPRLGNIERKITLEDGSVFATKDNDIVDELILKVIKKKNILHKFETNIMFVFISLVLAILFSFSFFKWGIPYLSKKIAYTLPLEVNNVISKNTLKIFDEYIFTPSILNDLQKKEIKSSFESKLLPLVKQKDKIQYNIHFRQWKSEDKDIANAFALPNGDIILTDKFVEISKNQDEINAVILHEMGHIENRHSMQRLIESTFTAVLIMYISEDTSSLGDLGIGLGSLFINSNYSRSHESQADLYAFEKMLKINIEPKNFANIINRITKNSRIIEGSILGYISSHPNTSIRINMAKKYSECYKKGIKPCK